MKNLIIILLILLGSCSKAQQQFNFSIIYSSFIPVSNIPAMHLCLDRSVDNVNYTETCAYGTPYFTNYTMTWISTSNKYYINTDCQGCNQFKADLYIGSTLINSQTSTYQGMILKFSN